MSQKKVKFSLFKIIAVILIGLALAWFLSIAILSIKDVFEFKEKTPYLYSSYTPYREFIVVGVCIAVFVLMLFFNIRTKQKWLSGLVNVIVIIALGNPFSLFLGAFAIPTIKNDFEIESEDDFNRCADDMGTNFSNFPTYSEFDEHDVQFVGRVSCGFFYYQSITAIVKYDSHELCEADYKAYIDSHQFLSEPVIDYDHYVITAPEFTYEGIFFRVITEGNKDYFPQYIYLIGIDRDNSTLYYLYLYDHDIDYIADLDEKDLEGEMRDLIENQFNLGK